MYKSIELVLNKGVVLGCVFDMEDHYYYRYSHDEVVISFDQSNNRLVFLKEDSKIGEYKFECPVSFHQASLHYTRYGIEITLPKEGEAL